jgi:hypothetical protein
MDITTYFACGDCGQIEEGLPWVKLRNQCKHCGKSNRQEIWPAPETRSLLEFINNYDTNSPHYTRIVAVFLSSSLELLLEKLLELMALVQFDYQIEDISVIMDAMIEGYQGKSRMLILFSKLGYGTFHQAVKKIKKEKFLKNWETITEVRNKVVHGKFEDQDRISPDLVEEIIIDSLYVFSQLHNEYNINSIQYRIATESKN